MSDHEHDCPGCHGDSNARAQQLRADVDNGAWDGAAAMSKCAKSDTPASCYNSICAGKKDGDPALQSSHALPHHANPGDPPNAAGVKAALSRLPGMDDLTNKADAQAHLEKHMKQINPDYEPASKSAGIGREARAAAYGARSTFGPAARMEGFKAEWRHEPVVLNGKKLHQLEGYSSVVGLEYEMWDMFGPYGETMAPGAFDETLAGEPDVAFLVNHKGLTMARTVSGTLQLTADARGEKVLAYVNSDRADVHDLLVAIDDENITEMSFAFMITEAEWDDDYEHLTITKVDQDRGDVSAVNYGANPYTSIAARSREFLRDLSYLPEGAQRAALAQLTERFGGVLLPSATGHGYDEASPARLRQIARNGAKPPQQPAGRSIALVLAEIDVDL